MCRPVVHRVTLALGIWGLRLITLFNFNADKTVTHRRYAGDKLGKVHWKIVAFTLVFAFCVSFIGNECNSPNLVILQNLALV